MEELLKNYNFTVNPKLNKRYELCKLIAEEIKRPIGQVMNLTLGWPEDMLKDSFYEAQKSPKMFWYYRKQTCNPLPTSPLKK